MNKVVREHYPVSKLPDDLRRDLGSAENVRVTIEVSDRRTASLEELVARATQLRAEGKVTPVSTDDAVARVRALRDEWDT